MTEKELIEYADSALMTVAVTENEELIRLYLRRGSLATQIAIAKALVRIADRIDGGLGFWEIGQP